MVWSGVEWCRGMFWFGSVRGAWVGGGGALLLCLGGGALHFCVSNGGAFFSLLLCSSTVLVCFSLFVDFLSLFFLPSLLFTYIFMCLFFFVILVFSLCLFLFRLTVVVLFFLFSSFPFWNCSSLLICPLIVVARPPLSWCCYPSRFWGDGAVFPPPFEWLCFVPFGEWWCFPFLLLLGGGALCPSLRLSGGAFS